MLSALPIVIIRAIIAGFISIISWTFYNVCATSGIATTAYALMPATWVIFFTSVAPMLLIGGLVAWVIMPLFTQRDSADNDNRSMVSRLFGV